MNNTFVGLSGASAEYLYFDWIHPTICPATIDTILATTDISRLRRARWFGHQRKSSSSSRDEHKNGTSKRPKDGVSVFSSLAWETTMNRYEQAAIPINEANRAVENCRYTTLLMWCTGE